MKLKKSTQLLIGGFVFVELMIIVNAILIVERIFHAVQP